MKTEGIIFGGARLEAVTFTFFLPYSGSRSMVQKLNPSHLTLTGMQLSSRAWSSISNWTGRSSVLAPCRGSLYAPSSPKATTTSALLVGRSPQSQLVKSNRWYSSHGNAEFRPRVKDEISAILILLLLCPFSQILSFFFFFWYLAI